MGRGEPVEVREESFVAKTMDDLQLINEVRLQIGRHCNHKRIGNVSGAPEDLTGER
jgi:hypothetical protein